MWSYFDSQRFCLSVGAYWTIWIYKVGFDDYLDFAHLDGWTGRLTIMHGLRESLYSFLDVRDDLLLGGR